MRMKKLLIIAAAALLAAACAKTYEVKETSLPEIGFTSWANTLTKARTAGSSTFVNGDDFNVYGFKTISAANTTVFNGDAVSFDGTDWTYDNLRFWDPNATSYTFYAASPAGKIASADAQTGDFTSNSIAFAGNDNDVLVADKKVVTKTGDPAAFASPVALVFNHIASLVDFKVKKHAEIAAATVAITSFQLNNIDNVGTFSVNDAYTGGHPVVTWNPTARGAYSNTSGVTSVATLPDNVGTDGSDFLINHLVAMPQTFRTDATKQTVTIEYSITSGGDTIANTATFDLKTFDNEDDKDNEDTIIGGWESGKHYTFYITINANAIVFTASITDWVTPNNGYNYLLQ
jgi:hypothetical protein